MVLHRRVNTSRHLLSLIYHPGCDFNSHGNVPRTDRDKYFAPYFVKCQSLYIQNHKFIVFTTSPINYIYKYFASFLSENLKIMTQQTFSPLSNSFLIVLLKRNQSQSSIILFISYIFHFLRAHFFQVYTDCKLNTGRLCR